MQVAQETAGCLRTATATDEPPPADDIIVVLLRSVKKHVGNLLLKLAAQNRTHAVARARELSLL